ncbi:MAG: gamma-glutamyltransferase [Chiayiivirga sp.]|jgi:gamma-glutamyltranspeptidase/glutathione hydrolase|uniref:Glutathione hydrolase proenzyme n=1 Tax=Denitratimonas tolerans TaxID=1338420 RepID=A0AAW9R1C5_9GAMM|nr:gamma-glutamyltransferase [Xanthomonadaceae bacterium]MDX9763675.1 gamma-glutamyltransferase [Chiayiivirga sp.]MEB2314749.1 gamma-glutamyltransferase [Xanthomonadaceae bacterium]HMN34037.1 gamma-glutamyltransferase [Chiayiivirga sp.]HRQ34391.1 gamma-glutamyltransferase [Chiayiivirga sp.]
MNIRPVLLGLILLLLPFSAALQAREAQAPVPPRQAAIASANAYATDAGLEVLAQGGNAFDAAVAVSATLGLVEPESSGIGGGALMLLHLADGDRDVFVDARERAPLAATRDMYLDASGQVRPKSSIDGPLAAAIPGLPAGLAHLSEKYGRVPLSVSLAPAIRLARKGWVMNAKTAQVLPWRSEVLAQSPGARELFLRKGKPVEAGQVLKNPDYARTLERLARDGREGFYAGSLARRLVDGVRGAGGIWTLEDLAQYRAVEREPLRFSHRGFQLVTAPPPSSGGVALAEILNVLSGYDYPAMAQGERTHLVVEAMRRAYRDRAQFLGDPDFVDVPLARMMSLDFAAGLRASIHPHKATPSSLLPPVGPARERPDTTHFSIIDTEGNLAAVTQTVNLTFGNAFAVPGTGFVLNNEMDDFSAAPGVPNAFGLIGDEANEIAPGKRPLSSMTPTFLSDGERTAAIGTPGGSRIITMVLLGLMDLMDGGGAQAAADRPRYHHQYVPDAILAEPGALPGDVVAQLESMGHTVKIADSTWGNMQVVLWNRRSGEVEAGSDRRWKAVGKGALGAPAAIYR